MKSNLTDEQMVNLLKIGLENSIITHDPPWTTVWTNQVPKDVIWPTREEQEAYWLQKERQDQLSRTEATTDWFDHYHTSDCECKSCQEPVEAEHGAEFPYTLGEYETDAERHV